MFACKIPIVGVGRICCTTGAAGTNGAVIRDGVARDAVCANMTELIGGDFTLCKAFKLATSAAVYPGFVNTF
jgi:hypothetical protein